MDSEVHSHAFQLAEAQTNSFLCAHPKNPQFTIASNFKSQINNPQQSMLYSLEYNENIPNKSTITKKRIKGQVYGLYPYKDDNMDFLCLGILNQHQFQLQQYHYNSWEDQTQAKQIYSQPQAIRDLLFRKNGYQAIVSSEHKLSVLDLNEYKIGSELVTSQQQITTCKIDPLHEYLTYVTDYSTIHITDKSQQKYAQTYQSTKYTIQATKGSQYRVHSIDYNPNRQYYLMTAHNQCLKFWDIRKGNIPVRCFADHHSLLLNCSYNHSHDQLVLCSYDNGTVGLFRMGTVSSSNSLDLEDNLVKLYDEHEDSVYEIKWSMFSPWIFASLSYSAANVVINMVPNVQKYRILL